MILQNNPHLQRRNELYALLSKESNPAKIREYESELASVEQKSREFTAKAMASVQVKIQEVKEQKSEALALPSIAKQYKMMCQVYHQADKLLHDVRSAKKILRDELKSRKKVGA
jgi:hypothetical protein